jgi:WD40 repeat protein
MRFSTFFIPLFALAALMSLPAQKANTQKSPPPSPFMVLGSPDLMTECMVADLKFSSKGELVSADCNGRVQRWDQATGRQTFDFTPEGKAEGVMHALSDDGSLLATVQSQDPMKALPEYIVLWDAEKGKKIRKFQNHPAGINGLAFQPGNKRLATADSDEAARLWDAATGKIVKTYKGQSLWSPILYIFDEPAPKIYEEHGVSFSPDGKLLGTAHAEGEIRVREVASGTVLHTLQGAPRGPAPLFMPDRETLAYITCKDIKIYNLSKKKDTATFDFGKQSMFDRFLCMAASPDKKFFAAGTSEARIYVWNLKASGPPVVITHHSDQVEHLAFSPDGKLLASGGRDGTLGLWKTGTGKSALPLVRHFGWITDMEFSPDGKYFATAGQDARIHMWDASSGKLLRTFHAEQAFKRVWMDHAIAFSPDGKTLWSASTEGDLLAWDAETGKESLRVDSPSVPADAALSPDAKILAMIDAWGSIALVDAKTGKLKKKLDSPSPSWGYYFVRWIDSGKRLAAAGMDAHLRIWNASSAKLEQDMQLDHNVYQLLVPPGAGTLIIRSHDDLFTYEKAKSGTWKKKGSRKAPGDAALSTDGKIMVLLEEHSMTLVDRKSGKTIKKIKVKDRKLLDAVFSPDGAVLAVLQWDGTVGFWKVP